MQKEEYQKELKIITEEIVNQILVKNTIAKNNEHGTSVNLNILSNGFCGNTEKTKSSRGIVNWWN